MQADQIWQTALSELQLQLTGATYDTWLGTSSLLAYENGLFTIGVQNDHAKDWLENRLHNTVKRTLDGIVGQPVDVQFVVQKRSQNGSGLQPEGDGGAGAENGQSAGEPASPTPGVSTKAGPGPPFVAPDFDPHSAGWFQVSAYECQFWAPLMGRVAWRVMEIVRKSDTRGKDKKTPWTPVRRWTAPALAEQVPCGRQAIIGVQRGEVRTPGAFGKLEALHLAQIERSGKEPHIVYAISVLNRLALLRPDQVAQLSASLRVKHDRWLEDHDLDPKLWFA